MLELKGITKNYRVGDNITPVLKGISFVLRDSEFVSVLGPSGCGKTTMLNIIGGLDKYSSGDLVINGKSTKDYNDRDWDTYRSHTIGFVFQSYNLIPHQTVLKNVELALSISNAPRSERKRLAVEALEKVGLGEHLHKKPNQLSGGQCQRVSIARALVTNPDIILADEPTGALDTETSMQIMDILKEISKDRLVLMVTHNPTIAEKYSTRIVNMVDGVITSDTNPVGDDEKNALLANAKQREEALTPAEKKKVAKKSSMSIGSALKLSLSNLWTKKGRTVITAIACSIGIIGIAVILSVSNGMQAYITSVQKDSSATNNIVVSSMYPSSIGRAESPMPEYPSNTTGVYPYVKDNSFITYTPQDLDEAYVNYIETNLRSDKEELVLGISYARDTAINLLTKKGDDYIPVSTSDWHEILENIDYLSTQYDILAGDRMPAAWNEVVLVVDKYNRISTDVLDAIGIAYTEDMAAISYEDLLQKEFQLILNDDLYVADETDSTRYNMNSFENLKQIYDSKATTVKIVAVLREKKSISTNWIEPGVGYTPMLTKYVLDNNKTSGVVECQIANPTKNVLTGASLTPEAYKASLIKLGADSTPRTITIYPKNFESKEKIVQILDNWNDVEVQKLYGDNAEAKIVKYIDVSELVSSMLSNIIGIITKVLIAFSVVSLIVSSIMIAIITYASVIERIKEIGIIRSLGGRKRDVAGVFIAEASTIGAVSAVIALIVTLLINGLINFILKRAVGVSGIATLAAGTAFGMIILAIGLTLVASLIPAIIAAKKDPVVALRTE